MKKLTIILTLVLISVVLVAVGFARTSTSVAAAVQADIRTNPEAGIQFQLPRGWRSEERGDDLLLWTKDETVQVDIWIPDSATFDLALRNMDRDLGKIVKNVKVVDQGTSDTHNGMRHFASSGTGTVDGTRCEWSVDILEAKKVVLILSFWAPGVADRHESEGLLFFNSIKKISAPARPPAAPAKDILSHDEAGIQFELPRGWRSAEKGDDLLLWTADETVQVDIWVPESNTFELALRNIDTDLGKVVKNVKVIDRGTSDTHNGMRHFATSGTGTVNGRRCEWSVDILEARKTVLILSYWAPGVADRHESEGLLFFKSIKKTS